MNRPSTSTWLVFCLTFVIALGWAVYSQQAWEDYYITYRASRNLAEGHGLTFTPGEKVHSYTSPLGVLLPAAAYLATGKSSDAAALWIFRLASIAALAAAVGVMYRVLRQLSAFVGPAIFLVGLLATDSKTVSFSINGMETGFLLLFAAWAIWALFTRPSRLWLHLGLAWGGLMWTRPDACIYIAAMSVGALLFADCPAGSAWTRRVWWCRNILKAGGICAVVYLPWFAWATWYYGSPIPHTITAKGLFIDPTIKTLLLALWNFPSAVAAGQTIAVHWTFLPAYGAPYTWVLVHALSYIFACVPFFICWLPFVRWEARLTSFVYLVGQFYLTAVVISPGPWYLPLVAWFGMISLALCFGQGLSFVERLRQTTLSVPSINAFERMLWLGAGIMVLGSAGLCVVMSRQAKVEMRISEGMVRRPIGEWLREHSLSPHETVFLEPLGFIGYFSNLKMLDFPGLGSPEVVAARKRAKARPYLESWPELVRDLKPDWVVLRPPEEKYFAEHDLDLLRQTYRLVKKFDATSAVAAAGWVPIPGYVEYNTRFSIYRRSESEQLRAKGPLGSFFQPTLADFTRKEAYVPVSVNSDGTISTHAPSLLALPLPFGARSLSGRFGIAEGAYKNPPPDATDGAEFRIETVDTSGKRTVVMQRLLEPATNMLDRGSQEFECDLTAASGSVEFIVSPGPHNQGSYDWAYWERLTFASPESKPCSASPSRLRPTSDGAESKRVRLRS